MELLVVFAIAALLMAVAPMAYERMRDGAQYRSTLRTLVSELRAARRMAVSAGRPTPFLMDLPNRRFGIQGHESQAIPPSLAVHATVAGDGIAGGEVAQILFLPDGGATGGSFDLIRASGQGARVRVDWFSGRVEIDPLTP